VRRSASIKKIKEKHRKLMLANHPDAGGSPIIAAKVNEAKDLLLKDYKD
jgi:DnaJ family protein C protein 19